ncbi:ubiquitin carboxyl-terminal hydrolase 13 [Lathyrus oleraceus]|uniref:Ubiquitin carboxyl-terminal hydrolase 13 n=1 Tax=Pisum sativum TaxID=3888 RepID=A0A9D4W3B9_PEA|nr:ubiquitin carboxyl-terminal hydrolase 13 [Pisum sativum]
MEVGESKELVFAIKGLQEDEEVLVPHADLPENNHQPMEGRTVERSIKQGSQCRTKVVFGGGEGDEPGLTHDLFPCNVSYVGRLFVKGTGKPSEILTRLNEMAGYDPEEDIVLYEEIKFEPNVMCEPIDKKVTFRSSQISVISFGQLPTVAGHDKILLTGGGSYHGWLKADHCRLQLATEWLISSSWRFLGSANHPWNGILEDGNIVCFQKAPSVVDNEQQVRYPDVPSYLEYVHNRQVVHFRSLDRPKEDDFSLEMSRLYTYDDVVDRVAQQLGLNDPSKILVAQPETANAVESQPVVDPPQTRFTWRIDNFTRLNTKKLYLEVFVVGTYKWRVLIFPKGNNVDYLSMYLDVADSTSLPYGWSRYAQFSLAIVNQIHNKFFVRKGIPFILSIAGITLVT